MQKYGFSLVAALAVFFGWAPVTASAQEAVAPAVEAVDASNSVELVDAALRGLIPVLGDPDLTPEMAVAAFNKAAEQLDAALMIARLDLDKARKDLAEYEKSGKGAAMDDLMDKTSNVKLQKMLRGDKAVQDAFVKFISLLGNFDRLLNTGL